MGGGQGWRCGRYRETGCGGAVYVYTAGGIGVTGAAYKALVSGHIGCGGHIGGALAQTTGVDAIAF